MKLKLFAVSAFLFLGACGGGGGTGPASQNSAASKPAPAQTTSKKILIEEYGDSTTYGTQTVNGTVRYTAKSEPVMLQALLREQFGDRVTVQKIAIGGTEAAQIYQGLGGYGSTWKEMMAVSQADIVTINYGLNDSFYNAKPTDGIPNTSAVEYAGIIKQMVLDARAVGKQVVLYEPNPTIWQPAPGNIYGYVYCLREVAAELNVPIVSKFDYIQSLPAWRSLISEDGVHPNDEGYRIIAQQESPVVGAVVASLLYSANVAKIAPADQLPR